MTGYSLNSTQETVRYKNIKDAVEEEQEAEILISSSFEENQGSDEEERSFPKLKIFFYSASILITLLVFFVTLGTLYYSTNTLQGSLNGSCVPLHRVEKVIIATEETDFKSCSDNKTCHSFLDIIEQKHDGLKYNFVIGQRGELYIGAGFKCLVNSDKNAFHVKLLKSEKLEPFHEYMKMCFRLSEIISHGIMCGKISPDYALQDEKEICSILESGKNKSYHVHDPNHEMKLIHGEFGWTVCGSFSSKKNIVKGKVITMESLPENSCSPLQLVDEITVDVMETSPFNCSDRESCIHSFEKHHDGLNYNFIIGHHHDVYVGLGFNCKAENTSDNILKIKVLNQPKQVYDRIHLILQEYNRFSQIVEEGLACGRISELFSVKANCNIAYYIQKSLCEDFYKDLDHRISLIHLMKQFPDFNTMISVMSPENCRHIVPRRFRYKFCHRKHLQGTTTIEPELIESINTTDRVIVTSESSCIPFKKVDKVKLIAERTDYLCSNNVTCPSLLDTIEQEHDGLKYNFVIGPGGELYIGAGFKCLVNGEENTLYVKLLLNEVSRQEEDVALCSRVSEIIQQGIQCEKISKYYNTVFEWNERAQYAHFMCFPLREELYKNRSHNFHDPDYKIRKLIPENFKWTFCGDFLNETNIEKGKVITLESLPENSCSPLQLVDEITVDVVETPPFDCSDDESCIQSFEKHHDGLNYNFIIGHHYDVYVGLGFNCKAENTSENILKIKVLNRPKQGYSSFLIPKETTKFLQIVEEGILCGRISEEFSVTANCNSDYYLVDCEEWYEYFDDFINLQTWIKHLEDKYYTIRSKHGRGVVPRTFRYQFCHSEHPPDTPTSVSDSMSEQPSTTPSELHSTESYNSRSQSEDDFDSEYYY